jgi:hypothetical protein
MELCLQCHCKQVNIIEKSFFSKENIVENSRELDYIYINHMHAMVYPVPVRTYTQPTKQEENPWQKHPWIRLNSPASR